MMLRSTLGLTGLALVLAFAPPSRSSHSSPPSARETAVFAGGCFWSVEKAFDGLPGVLQTEVGYAGGRTANPTYKEVGTGRTGHAEAVRVVYDPARITYDSLLSVYWHHIDPTTPNRAFCDRGPQYRSIIFYGNPEQKRLAEASKAALDRSGRFDEPVVTTVEAATPFYRAEEYHQQYYRKNPAHYEAYRLGCGRDARLKQLWGEVKVAKEEGR